MSDEVNLRDDWWHVILATPFVVPTSVVLLGEIGALVNIAFAITYVAAISGDLQYIQSVETEWTPNRTLWLVCGGLVVITFGIASYLVSPIYLYKRRKHA